MIECRYAALRACAGEDDPAEATAGLILAIFDQFYRELCAYPYRAKHAFETIDPQASLRISKERLGLYSAYVADHGPRIKASYPRLVSDESMWDRIDRSYLAMIEGRYEADIAFSFIHSIRRNIASGEWKPVEYSFTHAGARSRTPGDRVYRRLPVRGRIDADLMLEVLRTKGFSVPFRDERGDAGRIAERINALIGSGQFGTAAPEALEVVEAGFFRDLTAFIVGRWELADGTYVPFVVALLNSPRGICADAVLHRTADVHTIFSSTLANTHVTHERYSEICLFLYSLMPRRPLGLHYSTIGFNHVGKVAILNEIEEQMRQSGRQFQFSPGYPGTVAIGFTFDACSYHLKIIRDRPTKAYKWGAFAGVASVLDKYRIVHEINRAGSMLDNVMYFNLRLRRAMFDPALLARLCEEAAGSVHADGDSVLIRSLIVQLKITPLPVYLESADETEMREAIVNLGHCIRNNAASNIFNKDLDSRNYGVGRYGRVFLFDYDAVEKLTDVKIRTNLGREDGEEDIPGWFFETGIIFLPEELEVGMQIKHDRARRFFRSANADLLGVEYWQEMQRKLEQGEVPALQTYPGICRLDDDRNRQ